VDPPAAEEPEYLCGLADESLELYRGPIEITLTSGTERRDSIVRFDWRPVPTPFKVLFLLFLLIQ
jgi:hypothetical protein